jgi:hypothetical protein
LKSIAYKNAKGTNGEIATGLPPDRLPTFHQPKSAKEILGLG